MTIMLSQVFIGVKPDLIIVIVPGFKAFHDVVFGLLDISLKVLHLADE